MSDQSPTTDSEAEIARLTQIAHRVARRTNTKFEISPWKRHNFAAGDHAMKDQADQSQTTDPRIDRVARILFVRHYTLHGDASEEWATQFWDWAVTEEHKGDCPQAQHKGPVTCSACIVDEWRADARAVMGAL